MPTRAGLHGFVERDGVVRFRIPFLPQTISENAQTALPSRPAVAFAPHLRRPSPQNGNIRGLTQRLSAIRR
jgi:hypothetical protein